MREALVVGGDGFVGRALMPALADHAFGTTVLARDAGLGVLPDLLPQVDTVIHLASATTPGSSAGKPLQELHGNLQPTLTLLEALQQHPRIHLVYVSSGGTLLPRASGPGDEDAAVYARSYYGAGKIAAEHFIEAWCHQAGGKATVLRPSNLYGPGQPERPGFGVIPAAMGKLARGEVMQVWGDGSAARDYLYIDDFVRLLLSVVDAPPASGHRVFNACSGRSTSLDELLAMLEAVSGRTLQRSHVPARSVDAPTVRLQAERARATFGWQPEVALAEGLDRTWRWFIDSRR